MIILSAIIVVITYKFIWNNHTYIYSYCRLSLLIKCHYNVLIHTYKHILYSYIINILQLYQILCILIGLYAFQRVFLLLFLVITVILFPVLVRKTYIHHVYNINMYIL